MAYKRLRVLIGKSMLVLADTLERIIGSLPCAKPIHECEPWVHFLDKRVPIGSEHAANAYDAFVTAVDNVECLRIGDWYYKINRGFPEPFRGEYEKEAFRKGIKFALSYTSIDTDSHNIVTKITRRRSAPVW